ncbi:MAG: hypothetical protein E4H13_05435 [Calditrichales bacterium]|nr:MAG: hypothetical protein E4H13_05435 [Calditrichales bacterium]
MQKKLFQHLLSIALAGCLFLAIYFVYGSSGIRGEDPAAALVKRYTNLNYLDLNSQEDRAILKESLDLFEPGQEEEHAALVEHIAAHLAERMSSGVMQRNINAPITAAQVFDLLQLLLKFSIVYLLVLLLTYYSVETFGIYRFIRSESRAMEPPIATNINATALDKLQRVGIKIFRNGIKTVILLTLFSPAYVIAYSFKTRFDTDSLFLMILLGVISNGLLITYTQKYFTFLQSESRKGYVQTAIVKNLHRSYRFNSTDGIPLKALFRLRKQFPGHILDHIYENVRFQYLNTLKEQASFLITGLIIIEMALNIQGHLCYTLMQNILYKNLPVVLMIVFGIFIIVKLTEIFIDLVAIRQQRRIDNLQAEVTS